MVWYHKQDIWRVFHEVEVYNENQNTQKNANMTVYNKFVKTLGSSLNF